MELETRNKKVSYFFDDELALVTFNKGHPMRPFRMKITDELINVAIYFLSFGGSIVCQLRSTRKYSGSDFRDLECDQGNGRG